MLQGRSGEFRKNCLVDVKKISCFYFLLSQILESSQTLLDVLKGEIGNASKASEPKSTSKQKEKQTSEQKRS